MEIQQLVSLGIPREPKDEGTEIAVRCRDFLYFSIIDETSIGDDQVPVQSV